MFAFGYMRHALGLSLAGALLAPLPARAQMGCVPVAGGWGYPDWTTPSHPHANTPFDDRWTGSLSLDFGQGTGGDEAAIGGLFEPGATPTTGWLYFQWFVKIDAWPISTTDQDETSIFVGIAPRTANLTTDRDGARVFQIRLKTVSTFVSGNPSFQFRASSPQGLELSSYTWQTDHWQLSDPAAGWSPPPWLQQSAGVWVRNGAADLEDLQAIAGPEGAPGSNQWAVQLKIPIDPTGGNGVAVDPRAFRMWHYARLSTTVHPGDPLPSSVPYTWPRSTSANPTAYVYQRDDTVLPPLHIIPDLTSASTPWADFTTDTTSAGCAGISISGSDIGTNNSTNNSYVDVVGPNTFFAEPKDSSGTVPANSLVANFRFANWGSQVPQDSLWTSPPALTGVTGPNVGTRIEGPWQLTNQERCRFTGTETLTGKNGNPIPPLPACTTCPVPTGTDPACCCNPMHELQLHQCMLVKLRSAGGSVTFLRDSAIRNMDFVAASRFSREAEVSVRGLPDLAAGKRDVYLHVRAVNMPGYQLDFGSGLRVVKEQRVTATSPGTRVRSLREVLGRSGAGQPMLVIHAYQDTGKTIRSKGGERRLLLPQTSFGYVVEHDGPLEGWLWDIGAKPVPGVPNLYKVSVPNGGSVQILNVIEAVEPKRFGLALHGGIAIPHGAFSGIHTLGPAGALDFEYMFTGRWAALVQLGIDDFPGKSGQATTTVYRISANAKAYFLDGPLRLFALAGGGSYRFDPGQTKAGADLGGGVQWLLSHGFALEATYLFHAIANATPTTTYSDVLVGGRLRF